MIRRKQTVGRNRPKRDTSVRGGGSGAFSYYSQKRSQSDDARARYEAPKHHRRGLARLKHAPSVIAVVVIVICALYAATLSSNPRLQVVASESGKSLQRPDSVYAEATQNALQSSFLHKSKFTFDSREVATKIQQQFPEVASVIITVPLVGQRPIVTVTVSSPAFILSTSSGAYYMSDNGIPLVDVRNVERTLEGIVTVTDESGLPVTIGQQMLPTGTVHYVRDVIRQLQVTNTSIQSIVLPPEANELQVRIASQPYVVRFNTSLDPRVSVGTFLAVKKRLEESGAVPKDYIDVRVEERAYYR